ncbi:MAG: SDR family oxidoreductase [Planctomycetaceae bacterium]|nr:SDR family oxidoreductase [Planctomycetaceae bacterium]
MMYTLLTGATGLVGRYLLRDLLLNGHEMAVVVRASRRQTPEERIEEILQMWERELARPLPRPVVLAGDISEPDFGLSDVDLDWVGRNCDTIIHSAAILEFYGEDRAGEPWRTNLGGTQNMIDLCRRLNIRDIHHVSTAYVAGMQDGPAMEDCLDVGQSFRNDYEKSKFEAEQLVRAIDFADHVTVYRPAVISGDSVTGYTNTYHGLYLYLRLLAVMVPSIPPGPDGVRHTPIRLRMDGTERRNIIPVEWVSAVMTRLFETPEARGMTFHMAPDKPMTSAEMIQYCGEYFNSSGAEFCGYDSLPPVENRDENEDQWLFERLYTENMETYAPYERTDNIFDMTNTKRFAGDIVCPVIDRTVLHRYIDFGNEDRWGKRRLPCETARFDARRILSEAVESDATASEDRVIGLDITGPGGCQATVVLTDSGIRSVERGLPDADVPVLRLSADELFTALQAGTSRDVLARAWDVSGECDTTALTALLVGALQRESAAAPART